MNFEDDIFGLEGTPSASKDEAVKALDEQRDKELEILSRLNSDVAELQLDFSLESFNRLEKFYLTKVKSGVKISYLNEPQFPELINTYVRQTLVKVKNAKWKVEENQFGKGRYDLGIEFPDGIWTMRNYSVEIDDPDNIKMDSVLRMAMERFSD